MKLTPTTDFKVFFLIIAVLVIPVCITLLTINNAQTPIQPLINSSPLGYTWSLSLFFIPIIAILIWLYVNQEKDIIRKSFWITLAVLIPLGFLLDIFFGLSFFNFNNQGAVLGIYLPGLDISQMKWVYKLPIEEFIFYLSGFIAVLLIYIWCDEYWLAAYNVPDYAEQCKKIDKLVLFHPQSIIIAVLLIIAATLYKNLIPNPHQQGFPGYFTFLVIASFIPSSAFFKSTVHFINWRAFSSTFFFILLISLTWEATLASPYQWWNYEYEKMIGITIGAWVNLPIEAVLVWMAVTFTTVIIYETIKIWLHSGNNFKNAMFGHEQCKHSIFKNISCWIKMQSRTKFILFTMLFAFVTDLLAWYLQSGWIGAALITMLLNGMIIFYAIIQKDSFIGRLYLFGLVVGFGELPTDYLAVAVQQTLVYAANEPFIWKSPFYMPFSWTAIMVQFGYLGWWMIQKWGLWTASFLTGVLGAISLPTYEFIAKQADFWYYRNSWMVFFDSTPVYVIVGEFLLALSIPLIIQQVAKCKLGWIIFWGLIESVLIYISTVIAYHFFA